MPLSDTAIRAIKPREKAYKVADEKGLFILVSPGGSKLWRFKYRIDGKEKLMALGAYPDVGLKDAREKRDRTPSKGDVTWHRRTANVSLP